MALLAKATEGSAVARPKEISPCDILRTDVAKYRDDLKNGYLGKAWQAAAEKAVVARAAGEYDDWKEHETEVWWGQGADDTEYAV